MKEWNIRNPKGQYRFLINDFSFFKGGTEEWRFLLDDLDRYFNHKNGHQNTYVYEDQILLAKNDFHFIMFDIAESQKFIEEQTLQHYKKSFLNLIEFSPFYRILVDSWEELQEEIDFLSENQSSSFAKFSLSPFHKEVIAKNLQLTVDIRENASKIEKNLFALETLISSLSDKRIIIAIIIPTTYYSKEEYELFVSQLKKRKNGCYYFIFCEFTEDPIRNVLSNHSIYNVSTVQAVREQLKKSLPILWTEETFNKAANLYVSLVDKFAGNLPFLSLSSVDNLEEFTYLYSLFILSDIPVIVDLTGIPPRLQNYFDSLMEYRV